MGSIAEVSFDKPFEGAEKLLEITFQSSGPGENETSKDSILSQRGSSAEHASGMNLLSIERVEFVKILDKVNCTILNECRSNAITAFLLSESSLFVFEDKLIVKTCGQTNLLSAIDDFITLASSVGFKSVAEIFYSRPKFINPNDQPYSHRKFKRETQILLNHFNGGLARVLGSTNSDCYHLFCFSNYKLFRKGCTLEIIMHGLADERRQLFFKNEDRTASDVTESMGFNHLFGDEVDVIIDDYLFEPCGYSMNGIINQNKYMTVHVTPEQVGSYASFETDECHSVQQLVHDVLQMFRPQRFFVTLVSDEETYEDTHKELSNPKLTMNYSRQEYEYSSFSNHHATFARFQSMF